MTKSERPLRNQKSSFDSVDNILNEIVDRLGLDRRLNEHALLNLWPQIVGEVFASKTRPLFVDYENNLVIAALNASVAQELSFYKQQITAQLKQAARTTGVKINGWRIDLKHWPSEEASLDKLNSKKTNVMDAQAVLDQAKPDQRSLAKILMTEDELNQISDCQTQIALYLSTVAGLDAEEAQKFVQRVGKILLQEMRLKKWCQAKGFPTCTNCGQAVTQLHTELRLCSYCYTKHICNES